MKTKAAPWAVEIASLLATVVMLASACHSDDATPGNYAIDPTALTGCRAPDEPGCVRCCVGNTSDGNCQYQTLDGPTVGMSPVPKYNLFGQQSGACSDDCAACARCSKSAENALHGLPGRSECDCSGLELGIDPCFSSGSCKCYCSILMPLELQCPPAR